VTSQRRYRRARRHGRITQALPHPRERIQSSCTASGCLAPRSSLRRSFSARQTERSRLSPRRRARPLRRYRVGADLLQRIAGYFGSVLSLQGELSINRHPRPRSGSRRSEPGPIDRANLPNRPGAVEDRRKNGYPSTSKRFLRARVALAVSPRALLKHRFQVESRRRRSATCTALRVWVEQGSLRCCKGKSPHCCGPFVYQPRPPPKPKLMLGPP
jgi:hypothetical protein